MCPKFKIIVGIFTVIATLLALPITQLTVFADTKSADSSFFQGNSTNFNPDIAKFCLALSTAAYDETDQYTLTHSTLRDNNKDYTLVTVVIRGTVGDNEWISNFNINNSGNSPSVHEGFKKAEKTLLKDLTAYIKKLNINKSNTKFLITGHSRGAAIANLLAADLSKSEKLATQSNIYAYTFATPNVAKFSSVSEANTPIPYNATQYLNIFNAVNDVDIITQIPLETWGYGKYGVTYRLPEANIVSTNDLSATKDFLAKVTSIAPTLKDFYESNVSFLFLKNDNVPTATSASHTVESYTNWLNTVNPEKLTEQVTELQLKLVPNNTYA